VNFTGHTRRTPWHPNVSPERMLRSFEDLEREDAAARDFAKDELMTLIPKLGSYLTSCLLPMRSHLVCLILVGSFMTSVEASASSNYSLLMMVERLEMSLKYSARSSRVGIRVPVSIVLSVSLLFGNSKYFQSRQKAHRITHRRNHMRCR
jgi:hypothetical protein